MRKLKVLFILGTLLVLSPKAEARYNNTLIFSPLQLSDGGFGFGMAYEKTIDQKGYVALYLPVNLSFYNDDYNVKYNTFHFEPGLKFYPTGNTGKVKYSVGPQLAIISGTRLQEHYPYRKKVDRFSIGAMVNNAVNFNPTPHLYMNLEFGLGVAYLDQEEGKNSNRLPGIVVLGFGLGYRF